MDLPLEAGTYVIGVKFPNGKYVYTNGLNPRARGKLTGNSGLLGWNVDKPTLRYTASFFVDVLISQDQPRSALIVNAGRDSTYRLPKDSLVYVNGVVTGDSAFYQWYIVDSAGTCQVTGLQTLSPVIKAKEPCTIIMLLVGQDKYRNYLASSLQIDILPDLKSVLSAIEYYLDGTYRVITGENYFLMKSKSP
jgi:hypothetical protein